VSAPRSRHQLSAGEGPGRLELAAASDVGPVRRENQDDWALEALPAVGGALLVLADGMGGHADGGIAARLAVTSIVDELRAAADPVEHLGAAIRAANQSVLDYRQAHGGEMCGTTLVVGVVRADRAVVANIGDSRGYLLHQGRLVQLTEDHSVVAEQMRAGRLPDGPLARHPGRNVLTRALTGEPVAADIVDARLSPGDMLVMCSDGVWDVLSDERLAASLTEPGDLGGAAQGACDAAVAAGTTDNVTVVACRLSGGGR
jgi:serine/threonine protein phosphatase PrpC